MLKEEEYYEIEKIFLNLLEDADLEKFGIDIEVFYDKWGIILKKNKKRA